MDSGDVMTVKAGYARNFLVPQKLAAYATPSNFQRLHIADPEAETLEEKRARMAAEAAAEEDEEAAANLRAADLLKHYLRNKVVSLLFCVQSKTRSICRLVDRTYLHTCESARRIYPPTVSDLCFSTINF